MKPYTPPAPNLLKGCAFIIIGFFFMSTFGAFSKVATVEGSKIWVSFISYFTCLVIQTCVVWNDGFEILKTTRFRYHFGRALFGVSASLLYMVSMQYIPLLNATLLFNTTPLFIPLLAIVFMHTKIELKTWLSILIGFIGITIIIKPTATILDQPGDLIGLASGFFLAVAFIFVKLLTGINRPNCINFYFFFLATLMQLPFLFFIGTVPPLTSIGWAICGGLGLVLMQLFLVKAYEYADASKIGVFQYSSVVFVGIIDWLFWNQVPPLSDLLGVLLVMIAGGLILRTTQPNLNTHTAKA